MYILKYTLHIFLSPFSIIMGNWRLANVFLGKPKWLISVHGLEAEKPLLSSGLLARLHAAIHSKKSDGEVKWALPGKREGDRGADTAF